MEITYYRRSFQKRYNQQHGITPTTIIKGVSQKEGVIKGTKHLPKSDMSRQIIEWGDIGKASAVINSYFAPFNHKPTSTNIAVLELGEPEQLIEIQMFAVVD